MLSRFAREGQGKARQRAANEPPTSRQRAANVPPTSRQRAAGLVPAGWACPGGNRTNLGFGEYTECTTIDHASERRMP